MSRRVYTTQLQVSGAPVAPDTYFDKVVKYIPSDIVAAWVAVNALVKQSTTAPVNTILWVAFGVGLILTALWTWKHTNESGKPPAYKQIIISTVAFGVWVFALGSPFDTLSWYESMYASIALIVYTLVIGLVE